MRIMFKVLLVEDDVNLRRLIHDFLTRQYYDVYACSNGEEALEIMAHQHIDVVITDIMMPQVDGFELTKQLRSVEQHLPIIMITAKESWQDKKKGFLNGVDDYLVKPINLDELSLRL
ncbi:MAG TPA: DNA-binding response regulator, partial [Firmicutes bacterium]|nr:DNA-binding response regulator [Bacillota bacterium]